MAIPAQNYYLDSLRSLFCPYGSPLYRPLTGASFSGPLRLPRSAIAQGLQGQNRREDRPSEGGDHDMVQSDLLLAINGGGQSRNQNDPAKIDHQYFTHIPQAPAPFQWQSLWTRDGGKPMRPAVASRRRRTLPMGGRMCGANLLRTQSATSDEPNIAFFPEIYVKP